MNNCPVKYVCTTINNPQENDFVERVHSVIYNMLVTKDISNKVFDWIDLWGDILSSIA